MTVENALLTEEQERKFDTIRGLLRKAESTEFEAEASSFLAKAQEMMIRYRVDEATLWARDKSRREEINTIKVQQPNDSPGCMYKRDLLARIATLSSCRMYYERGGDYSSVVGYPKDLLWVEMLYTSVHKQGHFKMILAQSKDGKGMQAKTFRNNYWRGYVTELSQRLTESYLHAEKAVAYTGSQELVIASRKEAVNNWVNNNLSLSRSRAYDKGTRNDKAANHGRMAAKTTDITGGASTNIGSRRQGELT